MNVTAPLNELHQKLERLHLAGPSARLNGCTITQLESACSLNSNLIKRIWTRLIILISKGVWVSDAVISRHLFLNVMWVNSKVADGLLKGKIEGKQELESVLSKVKTVYDLILKKNDTDGCKSFLEPTPFQFDADNIVSRLNQTEKLCQSEDLKEGFINAAKLNLMFSVPFSLFSNSTPPCHNGLFTYSLYPYINCVESDKPLLARDYAAEKLNSICTKKFQLYEFEGKLSCWEKQPFLT